MARTISVFFLAAAALSLSACIERSDKVTLNPDGSGKNQIDIRVQPNLLGGMAANGGGTNALERILKLTKGVDAWSDVTLQLDNDGMAHFKGTAYFKDVSKFAVMLGPNIETTWTQGLDGGMVLTVKDRNARPYPPATQPATTQPEEDRVNKLAERTRAQWQKSKAGLANQQGKIKINLVYILPGKPEGLTILQPAANEPGGVELVIDGKKMIDGLDKVMTDDALLKAAIKENHLRATTPDNDLREQVLFGKTGPITATVKGDLKPAFDYPAEVAAARKAEPAMFRKLGMDGNGPATQPVLDKPVTPVPVN